MVLYSAFLSPFALDAVPAEALSPMQLVGLLIHLGPVFLLIGILAAAWGRPRLAGTLYLVLATAFTAFFKTYQSAATLLTISLPPFLAALIFIALSFAKTGPESESPGDLRRE